MDRAKEEQYAKQFDKEGSCYVKGEMTAGALELIVSGDGLAVLHTATCIIDRIAALSGTPFEEALEAVKAMHEMAAEDNVVPFKRRH